MVVVASLGSSVIVVVLMVVFASTGSVSLSS